MTHDPLCYMIDCTHPDPHGDFKATCGYCTSYCVCNLIAKVRADERNKIFTNLDKLADNDHVDWCRDLYCGGCSEIEDE